MAPIGQKQSFASLDNASSLADYLGVPIKALYCVELAKGTSCAVLGCWYPAVVRNTASGKKPGPRCCVHKQKWFPKTTKHRGHFLLGPQFFWPLKGKKKTCCCKNSFCFGIGYSASKMRIPVEHRELAVAALGASGNHATYLLDRDSDVRLAPWHFHPHHRIQNANEEWRLVDFNDDDTFRDNENKRWIGYPPPNYAPKDYLEIECKASSDKSRPQDR